MKVFDKDGGGGHSELEDIYLTHAIYLERYKTHEANILIAILDTANVQIKKLISSAKSIETKQKYIRLAEQIKKITAELNEQLSGQLRLDGMELIEEETSFVESAISKAYKISTEFNLPAPKKVWAAAAFGSYSENGYEHFESFLNGFSDSLYKTWDSQVRAGYLTGMTAQQINRAVLGNVKNNDPGMMQSLRRSLETNTKTMIASMAETARNAVYKENQSIFSGYVYLATLDSRTCLVCGNRDGKVYEDLEKAPPLPAHNNCRCLYLPRIKGREGLDLLERESVDGPVPGNTTWKDWLAKQDDARQMDILGPTRYAMYKAGLDTGSFTTDKRTLKLDEIRAKEGLSVRSPGSTDRGNEQPARIERGTVSYSGLSYSNAVQAETDYLQKTSNATGHEVLSFMSGNKDIIGTWEGSQRKVNITKQMENRIRAEPVNTVTAMHCHFDGSLFSVSDMNMLCRLDTVKNTIIALPNGERHYLSIGNGKRPGWKTIDILWNSSYSIFMRQNEARGLSKTDADIMSVKQVCELLKTTFKWDIGTL